MEIERYYNENGETGVLVGVYTQFSTLISDVKMALDKRIIEDFISNPNRNNVPEFICALGYDTDMDLFNIYCRTYRGIKLEFIQSGKNVIIVEEEGYEKIIILNEYNSFTT